MVQMIRVFCIEFSYVVAAPRARGVIYWLKGYLETKIEGSEAFYWVLSGSSIMTGQT
jgi:hypothetical protein